MVVPCLDESATLGEGYDVVSGWRVHRKHQTLRRVVLSRIAHRLISLATGVRLRDYGCTLKAYRREILDLVVVVFLHRYAQKPIYVFGACDFASLLVSGLAAVAMLYFKFWGGKSFIETPLPLVWSTMFFIGILCFLLGLIAEGVMRIYHEGRDHGTYRIAATLNLDAPKS